MYLEKKKTTRIWQQALCNRPWGGRCPLQCRGPNRGGFANPVEFCLSHCVQITAQVQTLTSSRVCSWYLGRRGTLQAPKAKWYQFWSLFNLPRQVLGTAFLHPSLPSPDQAVGWGPWRGKAPCIYIAKLHAERSKRQQPRSSHGQHLPSKTFKLSICRSVALPPGQ